MREREGHPLDVRRERNAVDAEHEHHANARDETHATITAALDRFAAVAAIFTAVGGLGAAAGAIAAWRAALSSSQAARDANDALEASLKPQVKLVVSQYGGGEPVVARAVVLGPLSPMGLAGVLPGTDVVITFNTTRGKHGSSESMATMEPGSGSWAQQPYLNVVIAEPSDDWPPPEGDRVTATVWYSDVRGVARNQRSTSVDLRRPADATPGLVSFQNETETPAIRIT